MHLKGEHMTKTEFAAEAESIARDYANVTLLRDRDGAPLTNGDRECLLYLSSASLPTRTPDGHEVYDVLDSPTGSAGRETRQHKAAD